MKSIKVLNIIEVLLIIIVLVLSTIITVKFLPFFMEISTSIHKMTIEDSAYNYIQEINKTNKLANIYSSYKPIGPGINISVNDIPSEEFKNKVKLPYDGYVTIEKEDVISATLCMKNYLIRYDRGTKVIGKCDKNSIIKLENIKLDYDSISLYPNSIYNVNPIYEPEDATFKVAYYEMANEKIARVLQTGEVIGVSPGETTLTITGLDNKQIIVNVTVNEKVNIDNQNINEKRW